MALNNENNPSIMVVSLGSVTTDETALPVAHLLKKSKIKSVRIVNGAAIEASDTNYVELALRKGTTEIATYDSRAAGQGALVALVSKPMVMVAGQEIQVAGSDLNFLYEESGTIGMTNAQLVIEHFPL